MKNTDRHQADHVLLQMTKNDLKAKYSTSLLGAFWIFVLPLVTIVVFWFVYEMGFRLQPVKDVPFILWFVSAYVPWLFFSEYLISGANCLREYSYLVKKVKFRVELLPVIKLLSGVAVHVFFILVMLGMFGLYRVAPQPYMAQILYYSGAMILHSYGLILLLSASYALFPDIVQVAQVVVQIGFWVTPIIWNIREMDETIASVIRFIPMAYIVEGYRDSMIYQIGFWEKPEETIVYWVLTGIVFLAGKIVFSRLEPFFADEL